MQKSKLIKGYIFAVASAVIYGCMPLMAKYIYADGVSPFSLVLFRNAFALPALAVLALLQCKNLKVPLKELPKMSLIAFLGCCLTPILLFSSYRYIDSGTATVFHFVYPALVVLVGLIFFKQKVPRGNLISIIVCIAGILLFFSPGQKLDAVGVTCALTSGFAYAMYVLLLSGFSDRKTTGYLFCFYVAAISSVIMFIVCIASGEMTLPGTVQGWLLCLLFAMAVTVGAVALFQQSTFIIGGQKTSILSTLEPITGVIVGAIVFGEKLTIRSIIGSVLVISASILIAVFDMRSEKKN